MNIQNVYDLYVKDVYRYSFYKLGNKDEAEDVTSETFLRILQKGRLNEIENIKAWIITIARNVIYERYREKKKFSASDSSDEVINIVDEDTDLEKTTLDNAVIEEIKSKLNELDEEVREIIILKIWEGLKFNEIAEVIGVKESTVKLKYYRGLEKIKLMLGEDKSKRYYAIAVPTIVLAIKSISGTSALLPSKTFMANLASNLSINSATMFTIPSLLATPAAKAAIAITAVLGVTGTGLFIATQPKEPEENTDNTYVSSPVNSEAKQPETVVTGNEPTTYNFKDCNIPEIDFYMQIPESWECDGGVTKFNPSAPDSPLIVNLTAKSDKFSINLNSNITPSCHSGDCRYEVIGFGDGKELIRVYNSADESSYMHYRPDFEGVDINGQRNGKQVFFQYRPQIIIGAADKTNDENFGNNTYFAQEDINLIVQILETINSKNNFYQSHLFKLSFLYPKTFGGITSTKYTKEEVHCASGVQSVLELIEFSNRDVKINVSKCFPVFGGVSNVGEEDVVAQDGKVFKLITYKVSEGEGYILKAKTKNPIINGNEIEVTAGSINGNDGVTTGSLSFEQVNKLKEELKVLIKSLEFDSNYDPLNS